MNKQVFLLFIVATLISTSFQDEGIYGGIDSVGLGSGGLINGGYGNNIKSNRAKLSASQLVANQQALLKKQHKNVNVNGKVVKSIKNNKLNRNFNVVDANQANKNAIRNANKQASLSAGQQSNQNNRYYNIKTSSDISCRKLRKFEKTLKNTMSKTSSFKKKVLFQDLNILKQAKSQLKQIIKLAMSQNHVNKGYTEKSGKHLAQVHKVQKRNKYVKARANLVKKQNLYKGFFQQQAQKTYSLLAQLTSEADQATEFSNLIQGAGLQVDGICNKYSSSLSTLALGDCSGLKNLNVKGKGYNYCLIGGVSVNRQVKKGYLARKQLCHAGAALKHIKKIYNSVYDLYSGYRADYLATVYKKVYARRKNLCASDQVHYEILKSAVASSTAKVNSKKAKKQRKMQLSKNNKIQQQNDKRVRNVGHNRGAYKVNYNLGKSAKQVKANNAVYQANRMARANSNRRNTNIVGVSNIGLGNSGLVGNSGYGKANLGYHFLQGGGYQGLGSHNANINTGYGYGSIGLKNNVWGGHGLSGHGWAGKGNNLWGGNKGHGWAGKGNNLWGASKGHGWAGKGSNLWGSNKGYKQKHISIPVYKTSIKKNNLKAKKAKLVKAKNMYKNVAAKEEGGYQSASYYSFLEGLGLIDNQIGLGASHLGHSGGLGWKGINSGIGSGIVGLGGHGLANAGLVNGAGLSKISSFTPHIGHGLQNQGWQGAKPVVLQSINGLGSGLECQSNCQHLKGCNSYGWNSASNLCQLHPYSYKGAINAGLYVEMKNDNLPVIHFKTYQPFYGL